MDVRRRYHFAAGAAMRSGERDAVRATRPGRRIRWRARLVTAPEQSVRAGGPSRSRPRAGAPPPVRERIASPSEGGSQGPADVPTNAADRALFARVSGGDATALRALYESCSARALAIALRVTGSRGEAEEVVQETFVQVWRQAGSYDASRGGAMAWIATIARTR